MASRISSTDTSSQMSFNVSYVVPANSSCIFGERERNVGSLTPARFSARYPSPERRDARLHLCPPHPDHPRIPGWSAAIGRSRTETPTPRRSLAPSRCVARGPRAATPVWSSLSRSCPARPATVPLLPRGPRPPAEPSNRAVTSRRVALDTRAWLAWVAPTDERPQ